MSEQYDPDHHISFSFTDTWDTPVNLKASIVMEWCKYKEIAEQLPKRIDELTTKIENLHNVISKQQLKIEHQRENIATLLYLYTSGKRSKAHKKLREKYKELKRRMEIWQ